MHETYMNIALAQAKKALELGNLPIGCCIVLNGEIIAKAYNTVETYNSDLMHAELSAIRQCEKVLFANKGQATLYSTLEPCAMCAGAIVSTSIGGLVYAADDTYVGSIALLQKKQYYDERLNVLSGVCIEQAQALLNAYVSKYNIRRHLKTN